MFPVDDTLFENAVIVHYRKARRDITKRRKAVEIRRGKSSETAVSEPCVGLDCVKSVDIEAQIFDGFHHLLSIPILKRWFLKERPRRNSIDI